MVTTWVWCNNSAWFLQWGKALSVAHSERKQGTRWHDAAEFFVVTIRAVCLRIQWWVSSGTLFGLSLNFGDCRVYSSDWFLFSCSNTCLISHYRRAFPKCEDEPKKGTTSPLLAFLTLG